MFNVTFNTQTKTATVSARINHDILKLNLSAKLDLTNLISQVEDKVNIDAFSSSFNAVKSVVKENYASAAYHAVKTVEATVIK